jgi:hypothetical protein
MQKTGFFLAAALIATIAGGCQASPMGSNAESDADALYGGQTLGSGHRLDSDDSTTATGQDATMASDSSTIGRGGQTLGSGH